MLMRNKCKSVGYKRNGGVMLALSSCLVDQLIITASDFFYIARSIAQ